MRRPFPAAAFVLATILTSQLSAFSQGSSAPAATPQAPAQPGTQPAKQEWVDRAEYDLFDSIQREQDASARLAKLDEWKQKYPNTQFLPQRRQLYLATYQGLRKPADVFGIADEILQNDPNNLQALSALSIYVYQLNPPQAAQLELAQRGSTHLAANIESIFSADKKPEQVSAADWEKSKKEVHALAQQTVGWVAMVRKENEKAEGEFEKALGLNPTNGQVSYWLATAIIGQKKVDKLPKALFHLARAAHYDGPGALTAEGRKQIVPYFDKQYANYHGDKEGVEKVIELAKASALPKPDFDIESKVKRYERDQAAQAEQDRKFPEKALWRRIKDTLNSVDGQKYFDESMKNAALPGGVEVAGSRVIKFKGVVVGSEPEVNPKELRISITDGTTPEITLKLDGALKGKLESGTEIGFEGVPEGYVKDPFNVVFLTERSSLTGLPVGAFGGGGGQKKVQPRTTPRAPAKKK